MNQCIHGIDLLRWTFGGEIEEVYGQTRQQFHDYLETEDVGMAVVKFKSGAIATIEGTVNVYPHNLEETLYIFGEQGTVKELVENLRTILMCGILQTRRIWIIRIKGLKKLLAMFMGMVIQAYLQI